MRARQRPVASTAARRNGLPASAASAPGIAAATAVDRARVAGFPPIAGDDARVLILGTMPGSASLRAQQYYAFARNAFWPIVGALFDFAPDAPYEQRCAHLCARQVAVWDVLRSCSRPGSLDADIDGRTVVANDFAAFFTGQRQLRTICFNGATAQTLFHRHVVRAGLLPGGIHCLRLPSTSPANASLGPADKLALWREAMRRAG